MHRVLNCKNSQGVCANKELEIITWFVHKILEIMEILTVGIFFLFD